jgi:methyltransferase-like protein
MKAILYTLSENQFNPLKIDETIKLANKKIPAAAEQINTDVLNQIIPFIFKGLINICLAKTSGKSIASQKPKISKLTLFQAKKEDVFGVTNSNHHRIGINLFDKYALHYMDGILSKEEILDKIIANHVKNGDIILTKNNQKIANDQDTKEQLKLFMDNLINKLIQNNLLI